MVSIKSDDLNFDLKTTYESNLTSSGFSLLEYRATFYEFFIGGLLLPKMAIFQFWAPLLGTPIKSFTPMIAPIEKEHAKFVKDPSNGVVVYHTRIRL